VTKCMFSLGKFVQKGQKTYIMTKVSVVAMDTILFGRVGREVGSKTKGGKNG